MKNYRKKLCVILNLLICLTYTNANSYSKSATSKILTKQNNSAVVSGRVSAEGKAVANISIALFKAVADWNAKPIKTAKTNADGEFLIENVPAGSYFLYPEVPAFILENETRFATGRYGIPLVAEADSKIENIQITLTRGAVITGKLTDSQGKPIISERLRIETFNEKGEKVFARYGWEAGQGLTDDRGVYRYYGMPAGKYILSYGLDREKSGISSSQLSVAKNSFYPRTFYPSVASEKEATIVEVKVGETAKDIDIRLGEKSDTYKFSGTLIDDETGKPFAVTERISMQVSTSERDSNGGYASTQIKDNGTFEMSGFLSGKYSLKFYFSSMNKSEYYSSPDEFQILDADLKNFKIRMKKGLSVSGKILLEDKSAGQIPVNIADLEIWMFGKQFDTETSSSVKYAEMTPEGDFTFLGLQSGEVQLSLINRVTGLKVAKIMRNGVLLEKVVIPADRSLDKVQIYIIYGNINLQGQINITGGTVPEGSELRVIARPTAPGRMDKVVTRADERGRFLIEGLTPEEYEISIFITKGQSSFNNLPAQILAKSRTTLVNGVTGQMTFEVNLNQTK